MDILDKCDLATLDMYFSQASHVAIVTHVHPDGDALGSSLGLLHYLASRGVGADVLLPDDVPHTLRFVLRDTPEGCVLPFSTAPDRVEKVLERADLLVCLDFNSFRRAEGLTDMLAAKECRKVLIDHHLDPDRKAFDVCFSQEEVSSASELLFWILLDMPEIGGDASRLPAPCARCLMTGMTTDSNNFANSVFPSTLEMASRLLAAGVDRDALLSDIYDNYREQRFRLLGHLLSDCLTITPEGLAYMIIDSDVMRRFDVREGDTESFVNMPLGIGAVKMSIFLKRQDEGFFRVSVRSKRGVSANVFARSFFHGGGHEMAAGGRLLIPEDVTSGAEAAAYVEAAAHAFFSEIK